MQDANQPGNQPPNQKCCLHEPTRVIFVSTEKWQCVNQPSSKPARMKTSQSSTSKNKNTHYQPSRQIIQLTNLKLKTSMKEQQKICLYPRNLTWLCQSFRLLPIYLNTVGLCPNTKCLSGSTWVLGKADWVALPPLVLEGRVRTQSEKDPALKEKVFWCSLITKMPIFTNLIPIFY